MRGAFGHLLAAIDGPLRRAAGVLAAMLPARWWSALDAHVPASGSALPAAVLTFLLAGVIGIPGFFAHISSLADSSNRLVLQALGWYGGSRVAGLPDVLDTSAPVAMTGLGLFTFLLLTPAGWATSYLGLTGLLRAAGWVVNEPFGDPLLTAVDRLVSGGSARLRKRRQRLSRAALEGPELPDRVVSGAQLGMPHAELVVVSSRAKPGWDKGTVVQAGERWFRIGDIEERSIAGRLRTLYPLTEHRDLGVIRRSVVYALPPIKPRE